MMFELKFKSTSTSWYRNGRRRALSDAGERLWHALKDCSDAYGVIEGDVDELAFGLFAGVDGWSSEKVADALRELIDGDLVRLYGRDAPLIEVRRHDEHQSGELIRKRGKRVHPEPAGNGSDSRDFPPRAGAGRPRPPVTVRHDTLRYGTGSAPAPEPARMPEPAPTPDREADRAASADVKAVFDAWIELRGSRPGARPQLSPKRRRRIEAMLKRFTADQLRRSLSGYFADPFWNGTQDGRDHLEIAFRLADVENVERGLDLADRREGDDDLSQYDRPINGNGNGNGGATALIPNPLDEPLAF